MACGEDLTGKCSGRPEAVQAALRSKTGDRKPSPVFIAVEDRRQEIFLIIIREYRIIVRYGFDQA